MDFENVACLDVDMANTVVKIPMDFENVACLDEDIANTVVKIGGYVWFASADLDSKWLREGGWNDSPSTMFPTYRSLIASGLRILIYSGDVDAVVPVTSTQYSIDVLKTLASLDR
ncbi:hypothetical protein CsSME_00009539 [Camellia sinensis var. sinensis]